MMTHPLPEQSAIELRQRLLSGESSVVEVASACVARIKAREAEIGAWAWFDESHVMGEAKRLDALFNSGQPLGPLHGMPVGVKDIIDTAGIPTENGCSLDAGRVPTRDATLVTRLKQAGALIVGKTTTTELAFLHPSRTRNPRFPEHTPGGSSSGSAAAVSDGMIPLAVGTQTGGSVLRPASFCGIVGYKPSLGAIPKDGVLVQSPSLDTPGVFARDPQSAWMLAQVLMTDNPATVRAIKTPSVPPKIGFIRPPGWDKMDAALQDQFLQFWSALNSDGQEHTLPKTIETAAAHRARINAAEMAYHFQRYYNKDPDQLSVETQEAIEQGHNASAPEYLASLAYAKQLGQEMLSVFDACDILLCPAALGGAPVSLASTGDSIFNGVWTMTGSPAITLPMLTTNSGLAVGVQLIARPGNDAALLEAAEWVWQRGAV